MTIHEIKTDYAKIKGFADWDELLITIIKNFTPADAVRAIKDHEYKVEILIQKKSIEINQVLK